MKFKTREIDFPALSPEPTIWALRKNPRAANTDNAADHSLYEHLFGYDPISLVRGRQEPVEQDAGVTSAQNPNLNILNAETNFAVLELVSDLPEDKSV